MSNDPSKLKLNNDSKILFFNDGMMTASLTTKVYHSRDFFFFNKIKNWLLCACKHNMLLVGPLRSNIK